MNYFDHPYISASDIKGFLNKISGRVMVDETRLQQIYEFGTLFHSSILEPYAANSNGAAKMKYRFFQDDMCRMIVNRPDFKRESEHYNEKVEVGGLQYKGRCKCDGESKGISTILELKGLSVTNYKAFEASIDMLNYDLAAVHYMLTTGYGMLIIVGISKEEHPKMFKKIIKKHDELYLQGEQKLIDALMLLREYSPEDVITL